jgi:hypothetical protein
MTRDAFDQASNDQPFEESQNLEGQLLYFSGLENSERFAALDGKLLLISEDHLPSYGHSTNFTFGYVLNQPLNQRVRNIFAALPGESISHDFQLMQVMDAGAENFEPHDMDIFTFITLKDASIRFPSETRGEFAFYSCETREEAILVGEILAKHNKVILVHSQIMIERSELMQLIQNDHVKIREATPEIVLNKSALMRVLLAFPREGLEPPKM